MIVVGIAWLQPKPPSFSTETDPVEVVARRLIEAYDHPLIGRVPPLTDSPDFPFYKLKQATFLTASSWKGDANRLYDAIERLKKKHVFTDRDAGSIDSARDRLLAGLDSLMQLRYGWLQDKVLPALKASGEAIEVELPPDVRVSFGDQAEGAPKQSFDRIAEVEEEIESLHRYVD